MSPSADDKDEVTWTVEARARLEGIPSFMREGIAKMVEIHARQAGIALITPEFMAEMKKLAGDRMGSVSPMPQKPEAAVSWADDARARLEKAPFFVREGVRKLAERRARQRGMTEVTSELITELRDESVMAAGRRMRKMGFDTLTFDAFDEAKKRTDDSHKIEVMEQVKDFLESKKGGDEFRDLPIMEKVKKFLKETEER
ncbi:MAG: hypothetical protein OEV28_09855 [Nitrospirota bacterium]|nr:hypothetical protein [Nitrospirota bacterium]